jgi:hypothetical protein
MALSVNNKRWCLVRAVEIAKEFGRGGSDKTPVRILKDTYKVLKELLEEAHQEEMEQGPEEFMVQGPEESMVQGPEESMEQGPEEPLGQ